jgi:hypothetical protein
MDSESGPNAVTTYKQRTRLQRQNKRKAPPIDGIKIGGLRSDNLVFSTTPINTDLDIQPTNRYELTQHPTKPTHTSFHRSYGTTICTIENRRLDKLHDIYNNIPTNPHPG